MTKFLARPSSTVASRTAKRLALGFVVFLSAPVVLTSPLVLSASHAQSAATAPITDLCATLRQIQAPDSGSAQARAQMIAPIIDRIFDLPTVLHNSIGMRYATLAADERATLLTAFRQFTIARYVSSFKQGGNAQFIVNPSVRPAPTGNGVIVSTTIGSGSDSTTTINYVMVQSGSTYRIVDILLNGHISQVAAQRADFSSTLARHGVPGLVTLLNRKTAKFMNN